MTKTRVQDDRGTSLQERVRHNLAVKCRVANDRLLVAVSGGSDSVALLRLLVELRPQFGYEIVVAHFDHQLRSVSQDDARFVRELGARLRLDVHVGTWDAPRTGEAAARDARHEFLQRTGRTLDCTAIVLGHHLDDQIETVLLRLGRGSGPRGLSGMHWRRRAPIDIVRPLLDCRRDELVAYLQHLGQAWRDDASNTDLSRTRNRVRHLVFPALDTAFGPGWRKHWSTAVAEQQALTSWLRRTSKRALARAGRQVTSAPVGLLEALDLETLRRLAEPQRRAALQLWLDPHGALGLRRQHLVQASDLIRNGQTGQCLDLPGALLRIERDTLLREHRDGTRTSEDGTFPPAQVTAETSEPPTFTLEVASIEPRAALRDLPERTSGSAVAAPSGASSRPPVWFPATAAVVVCADRTSPPFWIRTGEGGEKVRLLGAPGSRPLRRILQDKRVPLRLRRDWPVVADTQGIVWIPGVGIAERCRLDAGSSKALRLRLQQAARKLVRLAEVHDET